MKNDLADLRCKVIQNDNPHDVDLMSLNQPLGLFIKTACSEGVFYTAVMNNEIECFYGQDFPQPHQHSHFELMYVLSGKLTNYIGDKQVIYQAGDGCLMNRNSVHYETLSENCRVLFIDIAPKLLANILRDDFNEASGTVFDFLHANLKGEESVKRSYIEFSSLKFYKENHFLSLLDHLQIELVSRKPGRSFFHCGLMLRIFDSLQNASEFATQTKTLDLDKETYLVTQILNQLKQQHGNIKRTDLAAKFHYHPDYLGLIVKKHTGQTIHELANHLRLKAIQEQLTLTQCSIKEIAEQTGFQSESHFFQFFKKATGYTPSSYRKKYQST